VRNPTIEGSLSFELTYKATAETDKMIIKSVSMSILFILKGSIESTPDPVTSSPGSLPKKK
jgi:hypothetical protein